MANTYSGDLSQSRDFVRFLIGDTDSSHWELSNEEIEGVLAMNPNAYVAASQCADYLAIRYSRKVDKSVGDLSISYNQASKGFADLSARLSQQASIEAAPPYAGGISISDKQSQESDTDRSVPAFKRGMHDNPNTDIGDWDRDS